MPKVELVAPGGAEKEISGELLLIFICSLMLVM